MSVCGWLVVLLSFHWCLLCELTEMFIEPGVLPPQSLVESKPFTVHCRLRLMPNVQRRLQFFQIVLLPLDFGKGDNVSGVRVHDLGERYLCGSMIVGNALHGKTVRLIQNVLVQTHAPLEVGGLLVVPEREGLVDLLVLEGVEFDVD